MEIRVTRVTVDLHSLGSLDPLAVKEREDTEVIRATRELKASQDLRVNNQLK